MMIDVILFDFKYHQWCDTIIKIWHVVLIIQTK